jgi:tetratricopeptide (TPR) repeat protein
LYGEDKKKEAATAYSEALKAAPAGWSRYGRTTESLLFALQGSEQFEPCAAAAVANYPRLRNSDSAANVAAIGLDCALQLPAGDTMRSERIKTLELASREVLSNKKVVVAADDRSGVYQMLIAARSDLHDTEGEKRVTEEWASFLEAEAEKAKTAEGRAVFDSHRLSAYLALEQPERAIAMLERSQRELPDDYNPPARLAAAYKAMKKYDEALAASDRALSLAYGPRKLGILRTRAEIFEGKGDAVSARKTIEDAIALAESLPEEQRSARTIAALKKKLETIAH